MGQAVTDAASWYEQAEWMGISCTPQTNSVLEYLDTGTKDSSWVRSSYMLTYDVPLKGGSIFNLHTITWPSAFFDKGIISLFVKSNPRKYFLELMKDLTVPKGTELIYENTKKYFTFIETQLANKPSPDPNTLRP